MGEWCLDKHPSSWLFGWLGLFLGVTGWAPYWLMASCWRTAKQAGRAVDKNSRQAPSDAEHDIQETDCKGHWSVLANTSIRLTSSYTVYTSRSFDTCFIHPPMTKTPIPTTIARGGSIFWRCKKKKENSTLGISKQPRLQTHKKRMRSKKDVGLPEINGLLYAFHAILETFHCKECDGPSNQ